MYPMDQRGYEIKQAITAATRKSREVPRSRNYAVLQSEYVYRNETNYEIPFLYYFTNCIVV